MTGVDRGRAKVAVLTNVVAPYRLPIFERLAQRFEVEVVCSGPEANRQGWRPVLDQVAQVRVSRAWGVTFRWHKRDPAGGVLDTRYLHVNPGLVPVLLRFSPAAVISDELGFRTLVALVYGKLFRRPVWVWWGGTTHTERAIGWARRGLRRLLAPRIDRWLSYGASSTEYLAALGVDRERVVELQNSIPERRYVEPAAPAFHLDPRPVVLCVARLVRGKGVDLLLRAAARLQADGLVFSIAIVGQGPERPALVRLAEELKLRDVHFLAERGPDQVPGVYRSGDVLVFPTLDDVWGLVVNEALWSGLPALVSIYAGCAGELVPAASTFDPLNPEDFEAKLRLAVGGRLPPPDPSRLVPIAAVGDLLAQEVENALEER